jgi:hypothetical protein
MFGLPPAFAMRLHVLAGFCALALIAPSVQAEDQKGGALDFSAARAPVAQSKRTAPPRTAFVPAHTSRFANGVNMQMEAMSTYEKTAYLGSAVQDNLMYAEHSQAVQNSLVRTTRRAFRDYLMQVTAVDQLIERYKSKGMQSVGLIKPDGSRKSSGGRFGFDFGVSHFRPEVGVEYEVGRSTFKLSVDGEGRAGFRYRNPRWGGNQVSLGFDGGEVFYVSWHVGGF